MSWHCTLQVANLLSAGAKLPLLPLLPNTQPKSHLRAASPMWHRHSCLCSWGSLPPSQSLGMQLYLLPAVTLFAAPESLITSTCPFEWNDPPVAVRASSIGCFGRKCVTSATSPVLERVFRT